VVRARDIRHVAELLGPRDLDEELVRVHHMGLDLLELLGGEAAARDRQDLSLLGRDHRLRLAQVIQEPRERQMLDA